MTQVFILVVYIFIVLYIVWQMNLWLKRIRPAVGLRMVMDIIVLALSAVPVAAAYIATGDTRNNLQSNGNVWLGFLFYFMLMLIFFNIILFFSWLFTRGKKNKKEKKSSPWPATFVLFLSILVSLTLNIYGSVHSHDVNVTDYSLAVEKETTTSGNLKIAFVSDLRLGPNTQVDHIEAMVRNINESKPDVVIFGGNILDGSYQGIRDPETYFNILRGIRSKQGVYGVYGDRDVEMKTLAGVSLASASEKKKAVRDPEMDTFLDNCGIQMLADQTVFVNGVQLVGRRSSISPATEDGKDRMSVSSLLGSLDTRMPVVVVEHEPSEFSKLKGAGCDLVLSGHTRAGQFFPINLISSAMYDNSYGLKTVNGVYSLVTSGIGCTGPHIRVGTISEVCVITLTY